MPSLFNIGVNGLQAHQAALNVTGQNITNASTPGYTRQRAEIETQSGSLAAGVFSGAGVKVDRITRIADEFIGTQIRVDQALTSELSAFSRSVSQLESALYGDGAGIDAAIRDFFDALQNASNNPLDTASREFVIGRGIAMAQRFNSVAERIEAQRVALNGQLAAAALSVNEIASSLGEVNRRISQLQDTRDSDGLNAMIDRRDSLLKELAGWTGINTSLQPDGQVNVFMGKGQSLVLGTQIAALRVDDKGSVFLSQVGTAAELNITSSVSGGEMGGILSYQRGVLDQAQNELGHLAASIALTFNAQHSLGIDLDGNFGSAFFNDLNDPDLVGQRVGIVPGEAGASALGQVNVYIDDPLANAPSSYELRVQENGSYAVTRQSDGELVYQGSGIFPPAEIEFDGLRVEFADGSLNPGDTMLLRPYAAYGTEIGVVLTDPPALALGAPLAFATGATNSGSASLSLAEITDPAHPIFSGDQALFPPLLVRFVDATHYEILDNSDPANPQRLMPDLGVQTYQQGSENHILPYLEGTSVVNSSGPLVSVVPAAADLVNDLSAGTNNYPAGSILATYTDPVAGATTATTNVAGNSSAREIAAALDSMAGITASARTSVSVANLVNYATGVPVELAVNGELVSGFTTLNDLADAINANDTLQAQGISASSDGQVMSLTSAAGDDITLHFQGDPNESVTVTDTRGGAVTLNGAVAGTYRRITVGGEVSALVAPDTVVTTQLDGIFAAVPQARRADFGFDLLLSGNVAAGDEFSIAFNADAPGDNRNAQALNLLGENQLVGDPPESFGAVFAGLILDVGAAAGQAKVNLSAAESLLQQSESYRESVSGVNLDEEAANLIRFEQAYNASAQIIAVARDTFNVLLNSFN